MQSVGGGQYGVNEVQQFVVGGGSHQQHPPHIFSHLAHDISLSPSSDHVHPRQQQHLYAHHHRQQQQTREEQDHHYHQQTHQPQAASLLQHQHLRRQQHQQQQQIQEHLQPQQQVVQHHHHHPQQTVQHQHPTVLHQLGLAEDPDSPEEAAAAPSPVASRSLSPTSFVKQMSAAVSTKDFQVLRGHETLGNDDDGTTEGEEGRSTAGSTLRWPRQETLLLIKIRSEMDLNFHDSNLKGPLWEDVARTLSEFGYNRSAKKCKEKFENIHKYYKKTKDGKAGRQDGKNYRFFDELDALYGGRSASTQCADHASAALMLPGLGHGELMADAVTPSARFREAAESAPRLAVSDSSEENHDEPQGRESNEGMRPRKKRKRKESGNAAVGTSSIIIVLESMLNQLMDQQEAMQRKFLECMEQRERDTMARDEAWKTQKMERLTREHELRTQEHKLAVSRDAALIAVLQKVTGQTLQLPQLPPPPPPPSRLPVRCTAIEPRNQIQLQQQLQDEPDKDGSTVDPHSKRWPTPEVHALIRLRIDMESRFEETGLKGPLWEEISTAMSCMGYSRNAKRCKEKWENVNKYYKKTKDSNKKRPDNSKTCSYFLQLEALYRNGRGLAATPGSKRPSKVDDHHEQSDKQVPDLQQRDDRAAAADGGRGSASNRATTHVFSSTENGSRLGGR